jgi:hypothetical protein
MDGKEGGLRREYGGGMEGRWEEDGGKFEVKWR